MMETRNITLLCVVAVALWGGIVSWALDRDCDENKSCPGGLGTHLVVASFTGTISGLICMDAGLMQLTMIAVSAVSSSIGLPLLHALQVRVMMLFNDQKV
jgi:hypothetical protein